MSEPFEAELRSAMLSHDGEAPTRVDIEAVTRPARRSRTRWLPAAAAAAVVLAVGGVLLAVRPADTTPGKHRHHRRVPVALPHEGSTTVGTGASDDT